MASKLLAPLNRAAAGLWTQVRRTNVGSVAWGDSALAHADAALAQVNEAEGWELALYSVEARYDKLSVSLDDVRDPRGSPTLVHIEAFSRALLHILEARWEEDGSFPLEQVDVEVSSAGANRAVAVPDELARFAGQPLDVSWTDDEGRARSEVLAYSPDDADGGGLLAFRYALVRANRGEKGRPMPRARRDAVLRVRASSVSCAS